ncbi:MAG: hypothetical protein OEO20_11075 [Gemmatimonadota bacterium]|nr:hypothetical protein [Gemmatimonadota bacterium]MDH3366734.1 hypothetical protein [Gemmatimonadota bacterium]MDH3478835.1 hypothetical protein [Gemmatimonadota bacterium]MDH3569023.1 hypothetical protein [Gemmatimonadota bacterium]MDH5550138.1 hypothetical protein [Gemmatimonadota bacterium]
MRNPFLVFEDIHRTPRQKLFRIGGVRWTATPYAWLSPLFWCALGLAVAWAEERSVGAGSWLVGGVTYGLLLYGTNVVHSVGHIVAGWLVRAPMTSILLTATRDVTVYVRRGAALPARTRIARAAGGPALNLLTGGVALVIAELVHVEFLWSFGIFNLAIAIWTLLPISTLDGSVIWTSLRPKKSLSKARIGLSLIVVATVFAILFGREHALAWDSLGRLFIVGALSILAGLGRRWASIALGLVVATACAGLILGAAQAGTSSPWAWLFGIDAVLFALGYVWFLAAGGGADG